MANVLAYIFLLVALHALIFPEPCVSSVPERDECTEIDAAKLNCAVTHGFMVKPTCCQDSTIPYMLKGFCVDLNSDLDFCGSCSQRCSEYEDCCDGRCTTVYSDSLNCGMCGVRCQEHQICKTIVTHDDFDKIGFPACAPGPLHT